jgi:hypothetical protein
VFSYGYLVLAAVFLVRQVLEMRPYMGGPPGPTFARPPTPAAPASAQPSAP